MEKTKRISFHQKNSTKCPICKYEFFREDLLSGGGRLIAGNLTDELRRKYEKNSKYGVIYPMAYVLNVCPRCLYTAFQRDFDKLEPDEITRIRNSAQSRVNTIKKFFGSLNFEDDRNLELGAASYLLAVDVYGMRNKSCAPTFKNSICSIRAAWLFGDLALKYPERNYKKISIFFYGKAYTFYDRALEFAQNGKEPASAAPHLGPDTDKNWGYDGMLYMYAMLTVKIGSKNPDLIKRIENFEHTKRYLSRIFGMGKSSKNKPSLILDMTRDLYDKMNEMLEKWYQERDQQEIAGD
ncbi:MAG: DUF2225 domain-containing protein [Spirochaetes bacterium]|jgi:uncharacterized protein (DUF2225 family)|nr:DUF2225 domain-containing protein [Spirochaetota bacterium]